jgi:hypothetical protein
MFIKAADFFDVFLVYLAHLLEHLDSDSLTFFFVDLIFIFSNPLELFKFCIFLSDLCLKILKLTIQLILGDKGLLSEIFE